jgi:nitrous oxide reductase accessory protein NosL
MPTRTRKVRVADAALSAVLMTIMIAGTCYADVLLALPDGAKVDLSATCPVCGMVVGGGLEGSASYSYQDGHLVAFGGAAAAVFKDGHTVGFEGARCLFIYNGIPKKFGIDVSQIVHRYVTDFETKRLIDVDKAFLVLGSTVKGFMGYDLIPFSSKESAEKFMGFYGGKRIVELKTVGIKDVEREKKSLEKR